MYLACELVATLRERSTLPTSKLDQLGGPPVSSLAGLDHILGGSGGGTPLSLFAEDYECRVAASLDEALSALARSPLLPAGAPPGS